jgi:hypothetical protein
MSGSGKRLVWEGRSVLVLTASSPPATARRVQQFFQAGEHHEAFQNAAIEPLLRSRPK